MVRFFSVVVTGVQTIIESSSAQELSVKLSQVDVSEVKITSLWNNQEEAKLFARKNKTFEYIGSVEDITTMVMETRNQSNNIQAVINSIKTRQQHLQSLEQNRSVRAAVRSSEERIQRLMMKAATLPQRFL